MGLTDYKVRMPHQLQTRLEDMVPSEHFDPGVDPMTKLIYRNRFIYGVAVLALLALSSGAGVKWG